MKTISKTSTNKNIILTGILGLLIVLSIAFTIAAIPTSANYQWVVYFFLAATPPQIMIGLLWENNIPLIKKLSEKQQPLKGVILTVFTLLFGLLIGGLTLLIFTNGTFLLSPQISHFLIIAIIIMLWLVIIVNCWPFTEFFKNKFLIGFFTLLLAYALAFIIWKIFFNYEIVAKIAPWYIVDLDPKGIYNFIDAITFIITTCPIILYLALFDGWLLDRWIKKQPYKTIINTVLILLIAYLFQSFFVLIMGMDTTVYMVLVPICMVFGSFLVNNMAQFSLFNKQSQPYKGFYKMIIATLLGLSMYVIYYTVANSVTGEQMVSGLEGNYQLDLWIADTMLGISFPLIIVVTGFFGFWPIKNRKN